MAVAFGGFHTSAVYGEPTYTVSGEPSADDANAGIGRASISQIGTSVHAIGTAPGIIINVAKHAPKMIENARNTYCCCNNVPYRNKAPRHRHFYDVWSISA